MKKKSHFHLEHFQQMLIFVSTIPLSLPEVSKYVLVAMRFV